ncbi:MAG: NAD-dependent epimerase/dehydratase family protein [Elusimicrobia bacterium]|nr:NAD-dependent epimerase/dehydratase family protein [Elusimicrobiota bacterium]
MRIAITGSAGYVGNFLAEHFCARGHRVLGLDLQSLPCQGSYRDFRFVACDVRDQALLAKVLAEEEASHVIHLAYLMDPQHDKAFERDMDVNGSRSVFLAAHAAPSVRQFVHFSSASAYGGFPDNPLWLTEEAELRPRDWVYAQNKKTVEESYARFPKRPDFKLVNFRMCTAVGPTYFKPGGVVSTLAKSPFGLILDGRDTVLQFIHEDDVKALVELVLQDEAAEGTFNLAPDSYAPTRELNPNPRKIFLRIPKALFKAVISVLWELRLSAVSPTSVDLVAHGIVVSPRKLMDRYGYKFRYSTEEAFFDAVAKRRRNGTL